MKHRVLNIMNLVVLLAFTACMLTATPAMALSLEIKSNESMKIADGVYGSSPLYGPGQSIAVNGDEVVVTHTIELDNFTGTGIGFTNSLDNGVTWEHTKVLAEGSYNANGAHIAIGDDGSGNTKYHIVWGGGNDNTIYYMEKGHTSPTAINSNVNASKYARSIAADDNGGVHIAYTGWTATTEGYYYARSTDSGSSFSETETLIEACSPGCGYGEPAISVDENGDTYVAYEHRDGTTYEMHLAKHNGSSWTTYTIDTNGRTTGEYPAIAASTSLVCVSWNHYNGPSDYSIVVSCSDDGGQTWSVDEIDNENANFRPSIALGSGDSQYMVWSDGTGVHASEKISSSWSTPVQISTETGAIDAKMALGSSNKFYTFSRSSSGVLGTIEFTKD